MPLVSGVCRTASAPMLSHGGSRLNASKPEANPKTRYPTHTFSTPVFRRGESFQGHTDCWKSCEIDKPLAFEKQASKPRFLLSLREFSSKRFSSESPLKPLPPARPRWRQVFSLSQETTTPSVSHSNGFPTSVDWTIR